MQFFTLAAVFFSLAAMPHLLVANPLEARTGGGGGGDCPICPGILYSLPKCCATNIGGIVATDCVNPSPNPPTSDSGFRTGCATAGRAPASCTFPWRWAHLRNLHLLPPINMLPVGSHSIRISLTKESRHEAAKVSKAFLEIFGHKKSMRDASRREFKTTALGVSEPITSPNERPKLWLTTAPSSTITQQNDQTLPEDIEPCKGVGPDRRVESASRSGKRVAMRSADHRSLVEDEPCAVYDVGALECGRRDGEIGKYGQ
ncbi:hypothetical protein B0H14DRAFT_2591779 [Mycena olivaceomarginata]|nr:hypothetical protein B0H14DRAFT_2591779 [Mycena olivaceomarginata]